jgi:hypothetical protein
VKTLTFDKGKDFSGHSHINEQLQITPYMPEYLQVWNGALMKT